MPLALRESTRAGGEQSPLTSTSYDSRPDTYEHITRVRALMLRIAYDLIHRAHLHDVSKRFDPERETFDKYTPKLKDTVYGSDEYQGYLAEMQLR